MGRPELKQRPEDYYDATEARKYNTGSRIVAIQEHIARRCVQLLNRPKVLHIIVRRMCLRVYA